MVRDVIVAVISVAATLGLVRTHRTSQRRCSGRQCSIGIIPRPEDRVGFVAAGRPTADDHPRRAGDARDDVEAGLASHPPHKHTNEELLILKEGTLDALVDGQWKKVGPGSIVFQASNSCHGVRNVGTTPATYHIVNWSSPGN